MHYILSLLIAALVVMALAVATSRRPLLSGPLAGAAAGVMLAIAAVLAVVFGGLYALAAVAAAGAATGWGLRQSLEYDGRRRAEDEQRGASCTGAADDDLDDWRGTGGHPLIVEQRDDLDGHTITVERTADGEPVVVERAGGQRLKLVRFGSDLAADETIYMAARAAAGAYGAMYVPDLSPRSSSARHETAVDNYRAVAIERMGDDQ